MSNNPFHSGGIMGVEEYGILVRCGHLNRHVYGYKPVRLPADVSKSVLGGVPGIVFGENNVLPEFVADGFYPPVNNFSWSCGGLGSVNGLTPVSQSMFAVLVFVSKNPEIDIRGLWRCQKRGLHAARDDVNDWAWNLPNDHAPLQEFTFESYASYKLKKRSFDKAKSCWGKLHDINRKNGAVNPWADLVFQRSLCDACYRYNIERPFELCSNRPGKLQLKTAKDIMRLATPHLKPYFKRLCTSLKWAHLIGALDFMKQEKLGNNDALEKHGIALVSAWYAFVHVARKRTSSLAICRNAPLIGLARYWALSREENLQSLFEREDTAFDLINFGETTVHSLTPMVDKLHVCIRKEVALEQHVYPWHLFIVFGNTFVLTAKVRVLMAIKSSVLRIDIELTPPVHSTEYSSTPVKSACSTPHVKRSKEGMWEVSDIHDAQGITWDYICWILECIQTNKEQNCVCLKLFGSYTLAVCGVPLHAANTTAGGTFQDLCDLAYVRCANLRIKHSDEYSNTLRFIGREGAEAITSTIRLERETLPAENAHAILESAKFVGLCDSRKSLRRTAVVKNKELLDLFQDSNLKFSHDDRCGFSKEVVRAALRYKNTVKFKTVS